jgi:hypothetical protein
VQWLVGGSEESSGVRQSASESLIETGPSSNVIPLRRRLPNDQQRH